jgi:Uma2 family endonuclease
VDEVDDMTAPVIEVGMTAPVAEEGITWEQMVAAWQELDVPHGWRAEITGEIITVSPPPAYEHNLIAARVHRALIAVTPADCEIFQTLGLHITPLERLCIPDLVVLPLDDRRKTPERGVLSIPADQALLVAEITSKHNANTDRVDKLRTYAHGFVPLYLLIDRWDKDGAAVTLYSEPDGKVYQRTHRVGFGETITIPEPFDIDLDTSNFPR